MKKKYISVLSVISCLSVVLLHANGCFWRFSYARYWLTANVIECVCYFAVPVFFMISGANLIDYRERYDTVTFLRKRLLKTFIPFLFWSLIAYVRNGTHSGPYDIKWLAYLIDGILNSKFMAIYWFFLSLFATYLCIPALSLFPLPSRRHVFGYLIIAAGTMNIAMPFVFKLLHLRFNGNLSLPMMGGYLFYVLAGYYIDHYPISKRLRVTIYILGIIGLFTHIIGTQVLSYRIGKIDGLYKGYLNVPCVFYSLAIFITFKYFDTTKLMELFYRIAKPFAETTFGIYLIHQFLLWELLKFTGVANTSIIYRVGGGCAVFVMGTLIVKCLKRIPLGKYLLP